MCANRVDLNQALGAAITLFASVYTPASAPTEVTHALTLLEGIRIALTTMKKIEIDIDVPPTLDLNALAGGKQKVKVR